VPLGVLAGALRPQSWLFRLVPLLLAVMVLMPMAFLVYGSVSTVPMGRFSAALTLRYYEQAITTARYLDAAWQTLRLATLSTILATVIGLAMAWLVARSDVPMRRLLHLGVIAPFFLSPFIGALAWGMLLSPKIGLLNHLLTPLGLDWLSAYSISGIVWVMGLYYAPYVYLFVQSALYNLDSTLEEAAAMSGLGPFNTFFRITLPLVAPAVLSGMLLTLVAAAGQFGVPALLGTPIRLQVMTTYIYDLTNIFPSRFNLAAALSILLVAVAAIGVIVQHRLLRGRSFTTVAGKAARPKLIHLGWTRWPVFGLALLLLLMSTVLPLLTLLYVSLVTLYDGSIDLGSLTLRHYAAILVGNQLARRAILNTIWFSGLAATIAVALAVLISWIVVRTKLWFRGAIDLLVTLPAAIPAVALGLALLWTWVYLPLPIYGTMWLLVIGYVTGFLPFAVRAVTSVHRQIDPALEEAVAMVGGGLWTTLRHVTLPLLKPGIAAGWTLLFIIFVRELAISILLYSPGNEVLSVLIYARWVEGDYGVLAAMAMIQVALVAVLIAIASRLFRVDLARAAA
jgi:iron(III) transport system permease protein